MRKRHVPLLVCVSLTLVAACSGDPGGSEGASGGLASGGGAEVGGAPSGGSASGGLNATGGLSGTGGLDATGGLSGSGGLNATGGLRGIGGDAIGGASAVGGDASTGGLGETGGGGATGGGDATGGVSATGGDAGTGGATSSCRQPIGWATRVGRTSTAFAVTGGGNATPITVTTWSELASYASDAAARVIYVDGNLGGGWSGSSGDRLEIKSNKTIVGLSPKTRLNAAIHIKDATNVILRNIVVKGPGSNGDQAWDNINIEGGSRNVWVDHCEFIDGQDGNADVVKGPDNVTFTWCIFGYEKGGSHNLSNLIASSDDEPVSEGKLNITLMFNWFNGVQERAPRCRYGNIHVVNNLYTMNGAGLTSSLGVTNGYQCNVRTENNHFIGIKQPIDLGKQAGNESVQESIGNLFENCSGNQQGSGTAFVPPYEYQSEMVPADQVRSLVETRAGATLQSPESCD